MHLKTSLPEIGKDRASSFLILPFFFIGTGEKNIQRWELASFCMIFVDFQTNKISCSSESCYGKERKSLTQANES